MDLTNFVIDGLKTSFLLKDCRKYTSFDGSMVTSPSVPPHQQKARKVQRRTSEVYLKQEASFKRVCFDGFSCYSFVTVVKEILDKIYLYVV